MLYKKMEKHVFWPPPPSYTQATHKKCLDVNERKYHGPAAKRVNWPLRMKMVELVASDLEESLNSVMKSGGNSSKTETFQKPTTYEP